MWSSAPDGVGVCPLVFEADAGRPAREEAVDQPEKGSGPALVRHAFQESAPKDRVKSPEDVHGDHCRFLVL